MFVETANHRSAVCVLFIHFSSQVCEHNCGEKALFDLAGRPSFAPSWAIEIRKTYEKRKLKRSLRDQFDLSYFAFFIVVSKQSPKLFVKLKKSKVFKSIFDSLTLFSSLDPFLWPFSETSYVLYPITRDSSLLIAIPKSLSVAHTFFQPLWRLRQRVHRWHIRTL